MFLEYLVYILKLMYFHLIVYTYLIGLSQVVFMQKSKYKIKKDIDLNILLEKYGFEWGEDYEYELYHIRDLNDGSWSLCVDKDTRELFIYAYHFFNEETSLENKIINSYKLIRHYAAELFEDNLIEGYFVPPRGQLYFDNKLRIRKR